MKWLTVGKNPARMAKRVPRQAPSGARGGEADMSLLVGAYERQLDDKGRVALPSRFRGLLGDECYLAKGKGKCISVVPASIFEAEAEVMRAREAAGEVSTNRLRAVAGSAQQVTVDKQGRVNIDEALRSFAGLAPNASVTVAGSFDRLEIWAPERYAVVESAGSEDMAGEE